MGFLWQDRERGYHPWALHKRLNPLSFVVQTPQGVYLLPTGYALGVERLYVQSGVRRGQQRITLQISVFYIRAGEFTLCLYLLSYIGNAVKHHRVFCRIACSLCCNKRHSGHLSWDCHAHSACSQWRAKQMHRNLILFFFTPLRHHKRGNFHIFSRFFANIFLVSQVVTK